MSSKNVLEKLPPHNLEAERAVLGACLIDPSTENPCVFRVLEWMDGTDFYRKSNEHVFNAMFELAEREEAIDLHTLRAELKRQGTLGNVGGETSTLQNASGESYLAALCDEVPTAANVEFHAKLVHGKAVARRTLNTCLETVALCYEDKTPADEILNQHDASMFQISRRQDQEDFSSAKDLVRDVYADMEERAEHPGELSGILTGLSDLDRMTTGFYPGDLVIVAGRPSMGKTAFGLSIGKHVAVKRQNPVAIFSLEMTKKQLMHRLLCSEARVDSHIVRRGEQNAEEWERLANASEMIAQAPLYIDDTAGLTMQMFRTKARRIVKDKGVGLIIADYLQLFHPGVKKENREKEVSYMSGQTKSLAKELSVPVIMLSQLSRALETRQNKRPMLSDLRDSGSIEQDADIVLFPYRDEVYNNDAPEGLCEIIIGKQRNGPVGTAEVSFTKQFQRFGNLDTHYSRDDAF